MTTYRESDVGVRCFWVETGRPTLAARLMFRHGIADEPITESGWQHLLEHTALDSLGRGGRVDINGQVGLLETAFDFHGEPDAVAGHLTRLTRWLVEPRLDRLDHERGVLRAEADVRGTTPFGRTLSWRYGARGPGLLAYLEPGLGRATPETLAARAARVFVHDNAALVLDGPPPPGLVLELPEGALLPLQPTSPVEKEPATYEDGGIIFSGAIPRRSDMWVGVDVLQRVLTERLRHEEGGAYAPWTHYEAVDGTTAVVAAGSDIRPELTPSIVGTVLALLDDLASNGPRQEWVDDTVDRMTRAMTDPYAAIGAALGGASRYLQGRDPETHQEMVERVRDVTVDGLRDAFAHLRDTLLLGAPPAALRSSPLPVLRFPRTLPAIGGTSYRSIDWPADRSRLRITDRGVELSSNGEALEVRYTDTAGLLVHEDGVRIAVRTDGYSITIDPKVWVNGERAVADLDRRVPAADHLPHPATGREARRRLNLIRRWWPALVRLLRSQAVLVTAYVAVVLVFLVALLTLHAPAILGVGLVIAGRALFQSNR